MQMQTLVRQRRSWAWKHPTQPGSPRSVRIRWPQASKTAEWPKFDEDVDKVLEVTAK